MGSLFIGDGVEKRARFLSNYNAISINLSRAHSLSRSLARSLVIAFNEICTSTLHRLKHELMLLSISGALIKCITHTRGVQLLDFSHYNAAKWHIH